MARPTLATREQVFQAADALAAQGAKATARAVRLALGGAGSLSTILKHLHAWKAGQQPVQPAALPVSADVDVDSDRSILNFIARQAEIIRRQEIVIESLRREIEQGIPSLKDFLDDDENF